LQRNWGDHKAMHAEPDFVDVGELIAPPGVVPVVIKSLLFS